MLAGQVCCVILQEFGNTSVWLTPNFSSISVAKPSKFQYQFWPTTATFEP